MNLRHLLAVLPVAVLAACGGGGDSDRGPAEASGALMAGGVQGVHYSTPTRSGTTDSAGTFKYLPGETVTFSIGAIELGSAPGSSAITVFTLAGSTPPTTELALRRELDRARRNATPFVRAMNIQWLLLGLDADHDPSNGLDVRGAEALLAGATIDLGQTLYPFGSRLRKLAPGLTINIPPWRAVAQAYRSTGITVPVHARTANRTTPSGYPVVTTNFTTYATDGTRAINGTDVGDDGIVEFSLAWTYDSLGRVKTQTSRSDPSLTLFPVSQDVATEYDTKGATTDVTANVDNFSDGQLDFVYRLAYQNDTYGFPLIESMHQFAGDGVTLLARSEYHSTYDARHNLTSAVQDSDNNGDGVIDSTWTHTGTFDAQDQFLGSVRETDLQGDGVVDQRYVDTVEYGAAARTVVEISETDSNADGVIEARYTRTSHYDAEGWVVSQDYEDDYDLDGVADYRSHQEQRYDSDHRLVETEGVSDYDGDGVNENRARRIISYDPVGNIVSTTLTYDFEDDGEIDYEATDEHEYGTSGELLSSSSYAQSGVATDPSSTAVTTQVEVADGVLLLAQDYLEPSVGGYTSTL